MIRFYLVCLPYWIFVDYIFVRLNLTYLPANNLRRISTMYVRGYLQGSENGRGAADGHRRKGREGITDGSALIPRPSCRCWLTAGKRRE